MQAISGITARISEIQMRMAQLDAPRVVVPSSGLAGAVALDGTTRTQGASGGADAFGAALAAAQGRVAGPGGTFPSGLSLDGVGVGGGKSRLDAQGVPLDLVGYGNGRVPAAALSTVAGTAHSLWTPAARSLEALRAAAAADGVTIGITDSYRTYESQVDLAARKGLYSQGGLAATPGTSDHGWGMAADLALDPAALEWMRAHAGEYGFVEDTPRESWHWGYHPTH